MRFIMKALKKAYQFVRNLFKGFGESIHENPVKAVNDISNTIAGIATVGIGIVATLNMARVRMMKSIITTHHDDEVPADRIIKKRKRSVDEILNHRKNKNDDGISTNDIEVLKEISKSRNQCFRNTTPEVQLKILRSEGFDFESYKKDYYRNKNDWFYHMKKQFSKFGKSDPNKPFREEVDYGGLNFIMRPLDRFVHWVKNDPVRLPVDQIHIIPFDDLPEMPGVTPEEMAEAMKWIDFDNICVRDASENTNINYAENERAKIVAETLFKNKNFKKYEERKLEKLKQARFAKLTGLEILDEISIKDLKPDDKKKKKKKKDKDSYESSAKSGKKHKKNKKASSQEEAYEREAERKYQKYLAKVTRGEYF